MKKGLTFSVTSAALFLGINGLASADQTHTVKEEANLSDIARAFATTTNTIQSLNHLENVQIVQVGQTLVLPDTDIVEVKEGDTLQDIAYKYKLTLDEIYQLNPYLNEIIYPGQLIAVSQKGSSHLNNQITSMYAQRANNENNESGIASINESTASNTHHFTSLSNHSTPVYQQTWSYSNAVASNNEVNDVGHHDSYYQPSQTVANGQNYYDWGQCTYYAFDRRQQLGKSVGSLWGNANNWASAARQNGYVVNSTPEVGAIIQSSAGNYGHVGVVERQNTDGSILVSEMNWNGFGQKSYRTIHNTGQYNYIH